MFWCISCSVDGLTAFINVILNHVYSHVSRVCVCVCRACIYTFIRLYVTVPTAASSSASSAFFLIHRTFHNNVKRAVHRESIPCRIDSNLINSTLGWSPRLSVVERDQRPNAVVLKYSSCGQKTLTLIVPCMDHMASCSDHAMYRILWSINIFHINTLPSVGTYRWRNSRQLWWWHKNCLKIFKT